MNSVQLLGRLVRDPDIRYSQGDEPVCAARFVLAVDRRRSADAEQTADFINCVAFRKSGEFAEKYLRQGTKIACTGSILTGSYTNKDGVKIYTTEVNVNHFEFAGARVDDDSETANTEDIPDRADGEGFMNIPDGIEDEGLPFH